MTISMITQKNLPQGTTHHLEEVSVSAASLCVLDCSAIVFQKSHAQYVLHEIFNRPLDFCRKRLGREMNCHQAGSIHFIPKWRPINYSFFCTLISGKYTPYSKMAANKLFFCLYVNQRSSPRQHVQKQKKFEVKMRRRGPINMETKE